MTEVKMPEAVAFLEMKYEGGHENLETTFKGATNSFPVFTEAQLKQYGDDRAREALEMAADTCDSTMYIESDGKIGKYGPMTHANVEIKKCADAIRVLAKEIK